MIKKTQDMRHKYIKIIFIYIFMLLTNSIQAYNDGLYFNSHQYATEKRTSLKLNDNDAIDITGVTVMTFGMDLRNKPFFGNIFCLKTNDSKHIDAIFSANGENKYKPALIVDGKLYHIEYDVNSGKNIQVKITINKNNNTITLVYAGHKVTANVDLSRTNNAVIRFGMHPDKDNYPDVAPINVRDIEISYNGKSKYFWGLGNHDDYICTDSISGMKAMSVNGHWLRDDRVTWKNVMTYKSKEKLQVTFNYDDNIFYIVENNTVKCYDPVKGTTKTIKVNGGHRAMMYSNYIGYNNADKTLYTYNLSKGIVSTFDFATGIWSNKEEILNEPAFSNHSLSTTKDGSVAYAFGGYGFYRFKNKLFRIKPTEGTVEELNYQPKLSPRTWAASALVGDKLYIFGGYGNDMGEQEQPGVYYYDLSCIDLKTLKSEILWTMEGDQNTSFQLSSEMIYNEADGTFYAGVTNKSGRMIKIWKNEPKWKIVTNVMGYRFRYQDLTFNIYKSKNNKVYAVIDKRLSDMTHEMGICSIDLPMVDDYVVKDTKKAQDGSYSWLLLLLIIPAAAAGYAAYRIFKKKRQSGKQSADESKDTDNSLYGVAEGYEERKNKPADIEHNFEEDKHKQEETVTYYNQTAQCIQMLGKFVIKDKEGNDITAQFTKRTRNLFMMLLLHSEASKKGIEIHKLDETLWQEMDEESARNNRNVYMRKLRLLLETVGVIEVVNDKIYYRVKLGKEVFFDYHEALAMMKRMEYDDSDKEVTARTLELLFEGPLLPNYSFEWLDKFKADYSNTVISLLTRQLDREMQKGNDRMALKIAETIMMHDPFSDNALAIQCSILCRRHKKGIAKNVYDNFCKNYETCIGEKYHLSFAEVCK